MTYLRTQDDIGLFLHEWPVDGGIGTLVIVHGYGEHLGRYGHVAAYFNGCGISAMGIDLRGHGQSQGKRGTIGKFGEYHLDIDRIYDRARSSRTALFLLGHSLGGLIACDWLLARRPPGIAGVILSSPFFGLARNNGFISFIARALSRLLPFASLPSGLKGKKVTRDDAEARRYDADPLNVRFTNLRWFTETSAAARRVLATADLLETPLLLLYAGHDRIASVANTEEFARELTISDRTSHCYPTYYHEILNEPGEDRAIVLRTMTNWVLERIPNKGSAAPTPAVR